MNGNTSSSHEAKRAVIICATDLKWTQVTVKVRLSLCPRFWNQITWRHCLIQQWARALVYREFHVRTRQTITRIHCSLLLSARSVTEEVTGGILHLFPQLVHNRQHYDGRLWHSSFFSALLPYFMPRRWLQWMGRTCQASFLIQKVPVCSGISC